MENNRVSIGITNTFISVYSALNVAVGTNTGNQVSASPRSYGAANQGNKTHGTSSIHGAERVLQVNTKYLLRITNHNGEACKAFVYVSFYEGELSSEN